MNQQPLKRLRWHEERERIRDRRIALFSSILVAVLLVLCIRNIETLKALAEVLLYLLNS